jgi:hypothetical protein
MTSTTDEDQGQYVTKDPDSRLDYETSWATWVQTGETIATSQWLLTTSPSDQTPLVVDSATHDGTTATVWLTGGSLGTTYTVVNRITTDQGRTEDRSKYVTIQQH